MELQYNNERRDNGDCRIGILALQNAEKRAAAWLLKSYSRIYDGPELSLELYTRQCSIGATAEQLAAFAATIANNGVNPINKEGESV